MIVLWIDPGVRKLWFALVEYNQNNHTIVDAGILFDDSPITTRIDRYHKMSQIINYFQSLITTHHIDRVGIERLYFTARNQSNAEFVYWLRGALIVLLLKHNIDIIEIDPIQVKKYITWNAKANKDQVQKKIMQLFWLEKKPQYNDSADALGMNYIAYKMK